MNKVYIWGTGQLALRVLKQGIQSDILGFIETKPNKKNFKGKEVYSYTDIFPDYDAIIVANTYANEIYLIAQNAGLDLDRMIFLCGGAIENAEDKLDWKKEILGEKVFQIYLSNHKMYKESFYEKDKELYIKLNRRKNFEIKEADCWPIIKDKYADAGTVNNYFWQDLWASRLIYQNKPKEHYDIGSRLDGFIAHLLSFDVLVHMIDIRQFPEQIDGLDTIVADATELKEFQDDSIESLSALCSLEHFGLGRYGDPVDPEACFKCFENIQRKLKRDGNLYISLPVGKERVEFNAHRVFYASTIQESFNKLELVEYSCTSEGQLERNVPIHKYDCDIHNGEYRYGLFHFIKK